MVLAAVKVVVKMFDFVQNNDYQKNVIKKLAPSIGTFYYKKKP